MSDKLTRAEVERMLCASIQLGDAYPSERRVCDALLAAWAMLAKVRLRIKGLRAVDEINATLPEDMR